MEYIVNGLFADAIILTVQNNFDILDRIIFFSQLQDKFTGTSGLAAFLSAFGSVIKEGVFLGIVFQLFSEFAHDSGKSAVGVSKPAGYFCGFASLEEVHSKGFILFLSHGLWGGEIALGFHIIRVIFTVIKINKKS